MKKGAHFSPEQSERARQAQIARWAVLGTREQQSKKQVIRWTPKRRAAQAVIMKNRMAAMDETELAQFKKAISEGQTLAWKKPSPAREQNAEVNRQLWADHRAKLRAAKRLGRPTEDTKAEMIHALRTRRPPMKWDAVQAAVSASLGSIGLSGCKSLYARWCERTGLKAKIVAKVAK